MWLGDSGLYKPKQPPWANSKISTSAIIQHIKFLVCSYNKGIEPRVSLFSAALYE
jgi:hypothetical protein